MTKTDIALLNQAFALKTAEEIIQYFIQDKSLRTTFATSLGAEDQVITHIIAKSDPAFPIFTLDTGRMFPETYDLIHRTGTRYQLKIRVYFPDANQVEEMVNNDGINLFYDSIENRKKCCYIRKILPLQRALSGYDAWICGLRKEQSPTRDSIQVVEWDESNGLIKINPLVDWTEKDVWEYIHKYKIPYNTLHDQSYASIGCQPCTRALLPGEDVRAGRWWWEDPQSRECGLHKKE